MTTTTDQFQMNPDYYSSQAECKLHERSSSQTNSRYSRFNQTHFTAGDEEQFQRYRDFSNSVNTGISSTESNMFNNETINAWGRNKHLCADSVTNTFRYIFSKFKKGIFVRIKGGMLSVFLPFSKAKFVNEWHDRIKIDPGMYKSYNEFFAYISKMEGRHFNPRRLNPNVCEWYANNCLLRSEQPIDEGDTNVCVFKHMLTELCNDRQIPDIEFFINRRDFPLITRNDTEPYNHIWGEDHPLVSHRYEQYTPILGMTSSDRFADIAIPTCDDWARICSVDGKWFPRNCREFSIPAMKWNAKKATAVFRGSSTGTGVTIETNSRLKAAYMSSVTEPDEDGIPYMDIGITKWNCRPRIDITNSPYLQTIRVNDMPFKKKQFMSFADQTTYKYIVNIDGHVRAYRLSIELGSGSVVIAVASRWTLWFTHMLVPYKHFVPVKEDMSDLLSQIKWCRENDEACRQIAINAREFYDTILQKRGVLDFLQHTLVQLKQITHSYIYPNILPRDAILHNELKHLELDYPIIPGTRLIDIDMSPKTLRCFGSLRAMEWVTRRLVREGVFNRFVTQTAKIFTNNTGQITKHVIFGSDCAIKTTTDPLKRQEHIHELFVATKCTNQLSKHIPNFVYCYGAHGHRGSISVVTEFVDGQTLSAYMTSPAFNTNDFLFILFQISLALTVAQRRCAFIHYDLTPWNIIIRKRKEAETIYYRVAQGRVFEIRTTLIPVIIDYGKSLVIHDNVVHGNVALWAECRFQDIITILSTSLPSMLKSRRFSQPESEQLIHAANIVTGGAYCPKSFKTLYDVQSFFEYRKTFDDILNSPKYELDVLSPLAFAEHLTKYLTRHDIIILPSTPPPIYSHSELQLYTQLFAETNEDTLASFISAIQNQPTLTALRKCDSKLHAYSLVSDLEQHLCAIQTDHDLFVDTHNLHPQPGVGILIADVRKEYASIIENIQEPIHSKTFIVNVTATPYIPETHLFCKARILAALGNSPIPRSSFTHIFVNQMTDISDRQQLPNKFRTIYAAVIETDSWDLLRYQTHFAMLDFVYTNCFK